MSQGGAYRRDIDGLRALAIVPVVLFHAFPDLLPGGFIGVDIFFVISGYLISGVLMQQLQSGRFSIRTFYAHRVRRIFPALIVVLLSTFALGWLFAMPDDLKLIGKHMVTGAGFIQNVTLLREAGYFDVASETKPLLHLWSLAIEEQFYLVYPLVLWALWRVRAKVLPSLVVLTALSFLACVAWTRSAPGEAFFLPHTRMWELLAGGLLAARMTQSNRSAEPASTRAQDVGALAGLGLVAIGLLAITEGDAFPGWQAAVPVVGAALLIQAGPQAWVNRRVLMHPVATWIGLISYPLYLWHWPLLAFLHITNTATDSTRALAAAASVLLAWLTYRFIETPIRPRRPTPMLIGGLLTLMLATTYLGYYTWHKDGFPLRFDQDPVSGSVSAPGSVAHMTWACPPSQYPNLFLAQCWEDDRAPAKVAIVGDSKAEALAHGLLEQSDAQLPWLFLGGTNAHGSLIPVISTRPERANSQHQIQEAIEVIQRHPEVQVVVVATATRSLYRLPREDQIDELRATPEDTERDAEAGFDRFIEELARLGKKVILVVDNPTLKDPRRCMSRRIDFDGHRITTLVDTTSKGCAVSLGDHERLAQRYTALLHRLVERHPEDVTLFDLSRHLCDPHTAVCTHLNAGRPMYSYTDHVSNEASRMVAPALLALIRSEAERTRPSAPLTRQHTGPSSRP